MKNERLFKKARQYKLASKIMIIPLLVLAYFVVRGQFFDNKDMTLGIIVLFLIYFQMLIMDYIGEHLEYLSQN